MPDSTRLRSGFLQTSTIFAGAGGMFGQLLLLREMLVSFHGNELTMGIVLGNWMVSEALGAYLGGKITRFKSIPVPVLYILLVFLYPFLLMMSVFYTRGITVNILGLLPGEAADLIQIFLVSIMILAPVSIVHGSLYPLACDLLKPYRGRQTSGIIYIYETIGTLAGGILFTLIFAHRADAFQISYGLLVMHSIIIAVLAFLFSKRKRLKGVIFIFFLLIPVLSAWNLPSFLHKNSLENLWYGENIIHYENTPYGNIIIAKDKEEYTVFYDGQPIITMPYPDSAIIEDYVHLVSSVHPAPEKVFICGAGTGGIIQEILRHPVNTLLYAELDPKIPDILRLFPTDLIIKELEDPRVQIMCEDGRLFLTRTDKKFDLILIGFISPDTLQTNRLFTVEFFRLVSSRLKEGGILAFPMKGSEVYMGKELEKLNACIYYSLKETFNYIQVIPGDNNIFLASNDAFETDGSLMLSHLEQRGLKDHMFNSSYMNFRLNERRRNELFQTFKDHDIRLNYDFSPGAFFYAVSAWGAAYSPGSERLYSFLEDIQKKSYLLSAIIIAIFVFLILFLTVGKTKAPLYYSILMSGAAGMTVDFLILLIFQSLYGWVYQLAGLLIAAFMAGIYLGAFIGNSLVEKNYRLGLFIRIDAVIGLLLPVLFLLARILQVSMGMIPDFYVPIILSLYAMLAGGMIGLQFPIAVSLIPSKRKGSEAEGGLYAADLLGGWGIGLLISIVLFPLLGLLNTLLLVLFFKITSLMFLIMGKKWIQVL